MTALISEQFRVHPRRKFDKPSCKITKPLFLGDFSVDGNRVFHHDKRNLHYCTLDWKNDKKAIILQILLQFLGRHEVEGLLPLPSHAQAQ